MYDDEINDLETAEAAACNADADALGLYVSALGGSAADVHGARRRWYQARAARRAAQRALIEAKLRHADFDYMHELGAARLRDLVIEAAQDAATAGRFDSV